MSSAAESVAARARSWLAARRYDDTVVLVAGVVVLALALRLVLLGDRVAHWDEARVGYWIIHHIETGSMAYRRITHGPLVQHLNRWLFPVWGASDFTMRLPVALVSLMLPASVLLFREHLRKAELVVAALFLAANPVVLYYSRFMRSDVLVAAFMFVAVGLFVRFYDTRRYRYVYAAAALMACGFAAKENAIVYVLTWLGATGLLLDQALFRPRGHPSGYHLAAAKTRWALDEHVLPWLRSLGVVLVGLLAALGFATETDADGGASRLTIRGHSLADPPASDDLRAALWSLASPAGYLWVLAVAAVVFLGLSLFFYAPRGAGLAGMRHPPTAVAASSTIGFWEGVTNPSRFVPMANATAHYTYGEFMTWFGRSTESGSFSSYPSYLGRYVRTMVTKAGPLTAFAIFGFVLERWGSVRSRNLVLFMAYCGFVSVLGYPLGTDVFGAWIVVHAVVPLAVPAAVGVVRVYDWGLEAFEADDSIGVGAAAVVLLLVVGQVAVVGATSVYVDDQADDNHLVQYAQPAGDPRAELQAIQRAGQREGGTDVMLYYGRTGADYSDGSALVEESVADWNTSYWDREPLCSRWFNILPIPWYIAQADATTACGRVPADLTTQLQDDPPAVIITVPEDETVPRDLLDDSYRASTYEMRTYGTEMTFWVREGA